MCSSDLIAVHDYEQLLASASPAEFAEVPEHTAASMCYTSGTTGNPKGVVYTHRSTFLHTMATMMTDGLGASERDKILPVVPMFHANAWGLPYAGWLVGADLHMPARFLQAEPLSRFIAEARPTYSAAVPTIWADMLRHAKANPVDLSSIRTIICGGSAVPRPLIEAFDREFGISMYQAWGMTETSPLAAIARPPRSVEPGSEEEMDWRSFTGRIVPGVEMRIVDDAGTVLPWDGESVGEIQVRGSWITGS